MVLHLLPQWLPCAHTHTQRALGSNCPPQRTSPKCLPTGSMANNPTPLIRTLPHACVVVGSCCICLMVCKADVRPPPATTWQNSNRSCCINKTTPPPDTECWVGCSGGLGVCVMPWRRLVPGETISAHPHCDRYPVCRRPHCMLH
jgi:hypothetical protein